MISLDLVTTEELIYELYSRADVLVLYMFQDGTQVGDTSEAVSMSAILGEKEWIEAISEALEQVTEKMEEDEDLDIEEEFKCALQNCIQSRIDKDE